MRLIALSPRQQEVLRLLARPTDVDLVYEEGAGWWCGCDRVSGRTALALLRLLLVTELSEKGALLQRFGISSTGRLLLSGETKIYRTAEGRMVETVAELLQKGAGDGHAGEKQAL